MNGPDDRSDAAAQGRPSELDAAYARASHADGSRPSLSARASILANAQREAAARAAQMADAADPAADRRAQRIGPAAAANDSTWNWRAAAGFAGVAFAGVMALWLYRGNPEAVMPPMVQEVPEPPPASPEVLPQPGQLTDRTPPASSTARATAATAVDSAQPATATQRSAPAAVPQVAEKSALNDAPEPSLAAAPALASAPEPAPAPTPAAAPVPTPAPRDDLRREEAASARARVMAPPSAPARAMAPALASAQVPVPSAAALLQRWFPQALDSDADGQQYWFVLDRNGAVLRSGRRAWTDLPALQRWLESSAAEPRITRTESAHLVNRRGRDVELAYAWAAAD